MIGYCRHKVYVLDIKIYYSYYNKFRLKTIDVFGQNSPHIAIMPSGPSIPPMPSGPIIPNGPIPSLEGESFVRIKQIENHSLKTFCSRGFFNLI